jgi:hypothetical protein
VDRLVKLLQQVLLLLLALQRDGLKQQCIILPLHECELVPGLLLLCDEPHVAFKLQ